MKPTELKIGDWIFYKDEKSCKDKIVKVLTVDSPIPSCLHGGKDVLAIADNDSAYTHIIKQWVKMDKISPIPLTGEFLEKNGWEKKEYPQSVIYSNGEYNLTRVEKRDPWMFYHHDDHLTTVRSIHELQHILWALGMDDDLKI